MNLSTGIRVQRGPLSKLRVKCEVFLWFCQVSSEFQGPTLRATLAKLSRLDSPRGLIGTHLIFFLPVEELVIIRQGDLYSLLDIG